MANASLDTIFKERKFPFIVTLFILFSFVLLLTSFTTQYSQLIFSENAQLIPSPPPPQTPTPTQKISTDEEDRSKTEAEKETETNTEASSSSSSPISDDVTTTKTMKNDDTTNTRVEVANKTVTYDPEVDPIGDLGYNWRKCGGAVAIDYIPCLDNYKAIKALKSRKRMEHRERHCPNPTPDCLVPIPEGYKIPIPWPKSRDMIWFSNVPHPKLVDYKKDQNWVRKNGDYFEFPGGVMHHKMSEGTGYDGECRAEDYFQEISASRDVAAGC